MDRAAKHLTQHLTNRVLLYKQPYHGVLGKLGFRRHVYVQLPATIVVELPFDMRREQVNADIADFYQIEVDGAVLEFVRPPHPAAISGAQRGVVALSRFSDRCVMHEAMPILEMGGHVQAVLEPRDFSTHEMLSAVCKTLRQIALQGSTLNRRVLTVLTGCDSLVANPSFYRELTASMTRFKALGHSVLLNLDPLGVTAAGAADAQVAQLRRTASLYFCGADRPVRTGCSTRQDGQYGGVSVCPAQHGAASREVASK